MATNHTTSNLPLIAVTLFFSVWFATFSYGHRFGLLSSPDSLTVNIGSLLQIKLCLMLAGCLLMIWPSRRPSEIKWSVLVVISMAMTLLYATKFPNVANHSMMMILLLAGFFSASAYHLLRGQWRLSLTHTDYLPLMRAFLIVMYFWGTFHKINADFLHPDGCWSVFYANIPFMPDALKDPSIALYLGGYGTLALEALAMLLLLFPRTKYFAMLLGLFFHFLIGITATGNVAHFSAFAFALHFSFLSSDATARFSASSFGRLLECHGGIAHYASAACLTFIFTCVLLSYHHAHNPLGLNLPYGNFLVDLMWWIYAPPLMLFVALYGRTVEARPKPFLHSNIAIANIATLLLILNSMTSYIGLNANADLAMFSNLRTEWGKSNHYIINPPPYMFSYLEKENYIKLTDTNHPYLWRELHDYEYFHKNKIRRTFERKRYAEDGTPYSVDIIYSDNRKETVYANQPNHELTHSPSFIERHYLRFGIFDSRTPRPCSSR